MARNGRPKTATPIARTNRLDVLFGGIAGITYRRKKYDRFLHDCWQEYGMERTFMDYFLQPSENRAWRWAATIVKRYMEQSQMNSKIQLDDREVRGEDSLQYTATLSASELHSYLRDNTFQVEHSNTHRRLISICNLDTNTIRTLAETALWHQQDCLRDAFWKHISFETSIKIVEAFGGFKTPHIEFHLPYLK